MRAELKRYLAWWFYDRRWMTLVFSGPLFIIMGVWGSIGSLFDEEERSLSLSLAFLGFILFGVLIMFGDLFSERRNKPWNRPRSEWKTDANTWPFK